MNPYFCGKHKQKVKNLDTANPNNGHYDWLTEKDWLQRTLIAIASSCTLQYSKIHEINSCYVLLVYNKQCLS